MSLGGTARPSRSKRKPVVTAMAERAPIARVRIDSPVPHLDRDFDYLIPAALDDLVQVGSRIRVRFAGRLVDAFVTARADEAAVEGKLRAIERVIGAEPVLTPATIALVEAVADRYAGTFSDVVRAAVPPRHARAEAREVSVCDWVCAPVEPTTWSDYTYGSVLLNRLRSGEPTRAVWSSAPASSWPDDLADLARTVLQDPIGGVLIVVPDAVAVERVTQALSDASDALAVLTAEAGPERRYGQFLKVLRGGARVVVGTRASVFAPVRDLRLIIVWDDGDDALCDPHAPYWDARDVAALRSHLEECHLIVGSPARSVVAQQWCDSGWARSVTATKATISARGPRVTGVLETDIARDEAAAVARMPHRAWEAARAGLRKGAVLIQVGRRGYLPALACQQCRMPARCSCGGPLQLATGSSLPQCGWCGTIAGSWECANCGGRKVRASAVGAERTVEEIGRAFPDVPIISSHGGHRLTSVDAVPSIVVSTTGAEPYCPGGYAAVIILDARSALQRVGLDASEEAVRRWMTAAALAAPRGDVVIAADNSLPQVQAVVRWDPAGWAQRELVERTQIGLPPAVRMAALVGDAADIAEVEGEVRIPHRLLGPVPAGDKREPERMRGMLTVERELGPALSRDLRAITSVRSARGKGAGVVHVHLDPRSV